MTKLSLLEIYHHCIHSLPSRIPRCRSWRRHSNDRERPLLMSMAAPAYREVSVKTPRRMDYCLLKMEESWDGEGYLSDYENIYRAIVIWRSPRQLAHFVLGPL